MSKLTNKYIAKKFKGYRKKSKLSVEEVALRSGIRLTYYKRIEEGTAKRLTYKQMVDILNVYGKKLIITIN